MLRDKGVWSDAVGALSPWSYYGLPESVVTDCGSENMAYDVRLALRDLGIGVEHAPAGIPEMRGYIERFFRTISVGLMPRLTGRTFSSMIEKGDYDPEARAALTAGDLCAAIIRWVADIYHRSPHAGLGGETPANCWNRLTDQFGVCPPPDLARRRLALGTRFKRTVGKSGITVFGVRYHSEVLARWMLRAKNREVNLRWYSEDLGAIVAELDGQWFEVPAVFDRFKGVRAEVWLAAARQLRDRFKLEASLDEQVVFDAIRSIDEINDNAMRRQSLLANDWSVTRIQHEETGVFIGFEVSERSVLVKDLADTRFGEEVPVDVIAADPFVPGLGKPSEPASLNSQVPVSGTAASTTDPVGNGCAASNRDADDDPGFEFEDKW
ncbi:Mu transposase C-terminal domain-containing protein [Paracoccus sp. S-4012]|uniref:Mu transposase C-terminal domain-containing protein n=1 Tax=Paracoccus sp. S-4012 TaxID=2665648 RepID=UPI001E523D7C|nr:Mu transposase C-terminal domain-containing protein [Paracoccus sp. S-4012]